MVKWKKLENKAITIEYNKHDYGIVLRASGIFYFKKEKSFKTIINILNYWKLKKNLNITIVASLRRMNGSLIKREVLNFQKGNVINYTPDIPEENFEGSIEIEAFSVEDMVIPYIGIIVVYQSETGISMVHTYGRTYSNHEIEEKRILPKGEETCCNAMRDSKDIESFAIVHNGSLLCPEQRVNISILNHKGERQEGSFTLHELAPYETVKIIPHDHFPNLTQFLDGHVGYSSFSFHLNNSAFPRMLAINAKRDGSDFQVTHSNFNLSKLTTTKLDGDKSTFMFVPRISDVSQEVVIYPDCDPGNYQATTKSGNTVTFNENHGTVIPIQTKESEMITFKKMNGLMPTRIHTGIRLSRSPTSLTTETCLGVYHESTPPKRFFWGICADNANLKSRIFLQQFSWGDKETTRNSPVNIKLYSNNNQEAKEICVDPSDLFDGKYISELFSDSKEFLGDEFGYFTIFSPFPYCVAFSTLENNHGSIAFEHTM